MVNLLSDREDASDIGCILIDPPVGPYSTERELEDWISELVLLPDLPEVIDAREQAASWLDTCRKSKG